MTLLWGMAQTWSTYLQVSARAPEYESAAGLSVWLRRLSGEGRLGSWLTRSDLLSTTRASRLREPGCWRIRWRCRAQLSQTTWF